MAKKGERESSMLDDRAPAPEGVYRLTPEEMEEMREEFKRSMEWARGQLRIDPELKHL